MALFEVPGWTVPTEPVVVSKRRKRPSHAGGTDGKPQAAPVNVEKLMKKLETAPSQGSAKKDRQKRKRPGLDILESETANNTASSSLAVQLEDEKRKHLALDSALARSKILPESTEPQKKRKRKACQDADEKPAPAVIVEPVTSGQQPQPAIPGMTALQAKMKQQLGGARFRYVAVAVVSFQTLTDHL